MNPCRLFCCQIGLKRAAGLMKVDNVERVIALGTKRDRAKKRVQKLVLHSEGGADGEAHRKRINIQAGLF